MCVKRLRERFPAEVVKAVVLFGVQALGYDEPTEEQMHILQAFFCLEVMFLLSSYREWKVSVLCCLTISFWIPTICWKSFWHTQYSASGSLLLKEGSMNSPTNPRTASFVTLHGLSFLHCFTATSIILSRRCCSEYMHDFQP